MSGIWADIDPLSRARSKPAAPVTSMEQAEARPIKSPPLSKTSEPSSSTDIESATAKEGSHAKPSEAEASPEKNNAGLGLKDVPTKDSGESAGNNGDTATPQPSESNLDLSTTNGENIEEHKSPETSGDKPEAEPEEQKPDASPSTTEPQSPADRATKDIDPLQKSQEKPNGSPNTSVDAANIPVDAANASADASNESSWPSKLELPETEQDEAPHHGDLRKNSIAAMKQLGAPSVNDPAAAAFEEDAPFDFQRFMNLLRSRSADPIARYVKSFLQEFSRGVWSPTQQEKIVADFQKFISVKMREFEPFASLSKRDRRNASEGMEKLIMNRLYARTFPPKMPPILRTDGHNEDLLRDQVFEEKLRLWSWVEGRHLDINEGYLQSSFIQLAANELARLHQFKSPRDKTICILNCSKVVWALIRQANLEQNADSFLPLLIYVVIKAQPVHLVSSINYIQRFRSKEFQKGETAYYLSTLASAVAFVDTLDKTSLTISDEEFDQKMEASIQAENKHKAELQEQLQQPQTDQVVSDDLESHEGESSAAVLATSAGMLVERMRSLTTKFLEDFSSPEDSEIEGRAQASGTAAQEDEQQSAARRARHQYRQEEQAAREASRAEFRTEQLQRQQFSETSETLQQMFPALDKDVVEDVLRECGTNIGHAVDLCLALIGS